MRLERALAVALVLAACALAPLFAETPGAAQGTTYYVSPTGNDGHSGTAEQPYRTLTHAFEQLRAGDTLFVLDGEYLEQVENPELAAGTPSAPIRVQAAPGSRPLLRGLLWMKNPHYWIIDGLNVTWHEKNKSSQHLIKFSGGSHWSYTNAEVSYAQSYAAILVTEGSTHWTLRGLFVHDTLPTHGKYQDHLIYISGGSEGLIERNVLINSPNGRAVKIGSSEPDHPERPGNIHVRLNTMFNNVGPSNIQLSYDAHDVHIYRNIMSLAAEENVATYELTGANNKVYDNIGWDSLGVIEPSSGLIDGGGNQYVDPRFVDPWNSNFQPQSGEASLYGRYAPDWVVATPLVSNSFEDGQLAGWFDANGGAHGVPAVETAGAGPLGLSLAAEASASGPLTLTKTFEPVATGTIIYGADFLISSAPESEIVLGALLNDQHEFAATVSVTPHGTIAFRDGENVIDSGVPFEAGVWHRIDIVVDLAARTYSWRVSLTESGAHVTHVERARLPSSSLTVVDRAHFTSPVGPAGFHVYADTVVILHLDLPVGYR